MIRTTIGAVVLGALLGATAAQATSLINRDAGDHQVVVVEGDVRKEVTVGASQQLDKLCEDTCSIYVGKDPEPYEILASDKVEIKNGELMYQEESAQGSGNQSGNQ